MPTARRGHVNRLIYLATSVASVARTPELVSLILAVRTTSKCCLGIRNCRVHQRQQLLCQLPLEIIAIDHLLDQIERHIKIVVRRFEAQPRIGRRELEHLAGKFRFAIQ